MVLIGLCVTALVLLLLFSRFMDKTTSRNILFLVGMIVLLFVFMAIVASRR